MTYKAYPYYGVDRIGHYALIIAPCGSKLKFYNYISFLQFLKDNNYRYIGWWARAWRLA